MTTFQVFSKLVHERFTSASTQELFVTEADGDKLYQIYLTAFPEGTNPIYLTKAEHDCSCCRNFIKNLGGAVFLQDGKLKSIWEVAAPYPYDVVAKALHDHIINQPITDLFRSQEPSFGAQTSKQLLPDGQVKTWNHFHGKVAKKHLSTGPDADKGTYRTTVQVFKRGLHELTPAAINTVLGLIEENNLYRGQEHLASVNEFRAIQLAYSLLSPAEQDTFLWTVADSRAARFRNTVIGSLVQDLSEGKDEDAAVKSFEAKVAPTNYKRPTALITPKMVELAMATITNLGLEPALERRFAKLSDVSINNVLWVDGTVKPLLKGGIAGLLMAAAKTGQKPDGLKPIEIGIAEFMSTVLPTTLSMDMLIKNSHEGNFVSLTAPVHEDSKQLFKWGNDFAWSYQGNITDSIKERVKNAGGNVTTAKLRVSLSWSNYDDLDLYCKMPDGHPVFFGNKEYKGKRILDVDMNAGAGTTRTPVENLSWLTLPDGDYTISVNQYMRRESENAGFEIEVESGGKTQLWSCARSPSGRDHQECLILTLKGGVVVNIQADNNLKSKSGSKAVWGVQTETLVQVTTVMHSPNFWDDNKVGNKHWMFMLAGAKNPLPTRGIYNEFLASSLEQHRKVFETLGNKTKCEPTEDQLSGLGFSSTKEDSVTVKVKSATAQKTFNINFKE